MFFCCWYFRDVWNYQRRSAQNDLNMCKYNDFFASIQNSVVLKPKETTMLKSSNFSSVTVRTEAEIQCLTFCNCLWPEKPFYPAYILTLGSMISSVCYPRVYSSYQLILWMKLDTHPKIKTSRPKLQSKLLLQLTTLTFCLS